MRLSGIPKSGFSLVQEKQLILTVGLPRSGKTTWALAQGYPIVAPDAIRLAVTGQRYVELTDYLIGRRLGVPERESTDRIEGMEELPK